MTAVIADPEEPVMPNQARVAGIAATRQLGRRGVLGGLDVDPAQLGPLRTPVAMVLTRIAADTGEDATVRQLNHRRAT